MTALFITTIPLLVAGIELLSVKGKSFNGYVFAGLVLGFIEVILILSNNLGELFSSSHYLGFAFLFVAVISWAAGSVYSKYKKLNAHP